ncbi:MAG: DinB family protein [Sphingobacterium sp.]
MQKEILFQLLEQNRKDCAFFCEKINATNSSFRLTDQTASAGFIYRHIGETINLIGEFFGYRTTIEGTTMGKQDTGVLYDLDISHNYFEKGYKMLKSLVKNTTEVEWLEEVDTPWFGKLSRIKLFSLVLFHNSHHCGQISSTILKGN